MRSERPKLHIEVMPHGPYEVSGGVVVRPKTIIRSSEGRAMTWKTHDDLDTSSTCYLCRCGQSQDKPFCDGTHAFDLFDGTETASTNTSSERVEIYDGPGLKVLKDGELCQHAGFCTSVATNWFEMVPKTDDYEVRVQLIGMIEHCPSGALSYELDGEGFEPDLPAVIAPVTDGPLFVSGGSSLSEPMASRSRPAIASRCVDAEAPPASPFAMDHTTRTASRLLTMPIDWRYADPEHRELTHYSKFLSLVDGTVEIGAVRLLVKNPSLASMPSDVRSVAEFCNGLYSYLFVVLDRLLAADCEDRHELVGILYGVMLGLLAPMCRYLTTMPAGEDSVWGPTFEYYEFTDPTNAEDELRRMGAALQSDHPAIAPALRHLGRL